MVQYEFLPARVVGRKSEAFSAKAAAKLTGDSAMTQPRS